MKKFKKLLSLVLAMVMVLSVAMPVSAAEEAWYTSSLTRWNQAGVFEGAGAGSDLRPNENITRAEMTAVMAKLFGLDRTESLYTEKFTDVTTSNWFYGDVMACDAAGIVQGDGTTFNPNGDLTREQAFVIMMRALKVVGLSDGAADLSALEGRFEDTAEVSEWAQTAVAEIIALDVVRGNDNDNDGLYEIRPQDKITRAEVAKIVDRLIGVYVDKEGNVSVAAKESEVDREQNVTGAFVVIHAQQETQVQVEVEVQGEDVVIIVSQVQEVINEETGAPEQKLVVVQEVKVEPAVEEPVVIVVQKDPETGKTEVKDEVITEDNGICVDGSNKDEDGNAPIIKDEEHAWEAPANCAVDHKEYANCAVCGRVERDVVAKPHVLDADGNCTVCTMKAADALKFNVHVESNDNYVDVTVNNDYAATVVVTPGEVSAQSVTISATMQDVGSLGVEDTRHAEVTFNTGFEGTPALKTWLSNAFDFGTGYVNATIIDKTEAEEKFDVSYELEGTLVGENAVVTATPANVNDTRAAWQEITSHVASTTQDKDDSKIEIGNGSYMIIGDDKLSFEKDAEGNLVLDNISSKDGLSAVMDKIRDYVQLNTNDAFLSEDYDAVFYLAAGTELAVSNSIATLKDNCMITVDNLSSEKMDTILPTLQAAKGGTEMATALVQMINEIIGSVDGNGAVDVVMTFTAPVEKDTKFYLGVTANNANGEGTTTVDMEVFDDYSFEINLPMNEISAESVTLDVLMKNVGSLGVNGERKHSQTINTGMKATGDLAYWMRDAKNFTNATINATIDGLPCTYVLESDMDADWVTVTGTTDTEEARAAWAALTSHVTTKTQEVADSKIVIANGSYIDTTFEKLMFETKNDLVLDNFSDLSALKANIKENVVLVDGEADVITLVVKAGTQLAVSNSVATLDDDCTITIEGATLSEDILGQIRSASNEGNEALVKALFNVLNDIVKTANGATLDVNMTFATPVVEAPTVEAQ